MAIGDVKQGTGSLASGVLFAIQPPVGEEWVIHNLYYTQPVSLRLVSGGNVIKFDSDTTGGARLGMVFHLTNGHYLQLLNDATIENKVAYDGIQTK